MRTILVSSAFWVVVAIISVSIIGWYGPSLETRWFPVLDHQVANATRDGTKIQFTVEATKTRACRIEQIGFSLIRQQGVVIERMPISVTTLSGAPIGQSTYPVGRFKMGPFIMVLPGGWEDTTAVDASIFYRCHSAWATYQRFGPVPIPPA